MRIKAHPTTYAGVNFRSRLEATWAAFFDLCGWRWQYEPLDLEGWVPDFALGHDLSILCEVKPVVIQYEKLVPDVFAKVQPLWGLCLGLGPFMTDYGPMIGAITGHGDHGAVCFKGMPGRCDLRVFALDSDSGDMGLIEERPSRETGDFMGLWRQAQNATRWQPK